MKKTNFLLLFMLLFTALSGYAHEKTDTIKVNGGNCESCKHQIEISLQVEGIAKAEWNVHTKLLIVTYNTHQIRNIDIQKKLADVGYDTEKQQATEESYSKLEACCKYRKIMPV